MKIIFTNNFPVEGGDLSIVAVWPGGSHTCATLCKPHNLIVPPVSPSVKEG